MLFQTPFHSAKKKTLTGKQWSRNQFNMITCKIAEYVLHTFTHRQFQSEHVPPRTDTHATLLSDSVCRTIANSGTHPPAAEIKQDASIPLFLPSVRRAEPASTPLYLRPQPPRQGDGLCLLTNASLVTDNRNM